MLAKIWRGYTRRASACTLEYTTACRAIMCNEGRLASWPGVLENLRCKSERSYERSVADLGFLRGDADFSMLYCIIAFERKLINKAVPTKL